MLSALIVTATVVVGLGYATRTPRGIDIISRTPYNNRYTDATAAREDHLG